MKNNILQNSIFQKSIVSIILVIVAICSIFVISPKLSSTEFHSNSIKSLDDKKMKVVGLSAASVGTATALAMVPGDSTTPLANKIMDLSTYFIWIIGAIFLEKSLLTVSAYLSFTYIIPIASILLIVAKLFNKEVFKNIGIKLAIFAILFTSIIPFSLKISDMIEATYQQTFDEIVTESEEIQKATDEESNQGSEEWN